MNYIPFVVLLFFINLSDNFTKVKKGFLQDSSVEAGNQKSPKAEAFNVLRNKCNACHATKKRTEVFTFENMDSLARPIHEQVFIKKKMPKGRKVKLTEDELSSLEKWLTIILQDIK